jgi:hypothetical protein
MVLLKEGGVNPHFITADRKLVDRAIPVASATTGREDEGEVNSSSQHDSNSPSASLPTRRHVD